MIRVLTACEVSGVVRRAFAAKGYDAWSCDLMPSDDNSDHHIQDDIRKIFRGEFVSVQQNTGRADEIKFSSFDLIIAFPPCDDLAGSGARWFEKKRLNGSQQKSIDFFMEFVNYQKLTDVPMCIENPVGIMSSIYRKPDQIIQPYNFGHRVTKKTCLWLFDLPLIEGSGVPGPPRTPEEKREYARTQHLHPPGPDRKKNRSRTYEGIAEAMTVYGEIIQKRKSFIKKNS